VVACLEPVARAEGPEGTYTIEEFRAGPTLLPVGVVMKARTRHSHQTSETLEVKPETVSDSLAEAIPSVGLRDEGSLGGRGSSELGILHSAGP
jgi:hypothetical protein